MDNVSVLQLVCQCPSSDSHSLSRFPLPVLILICLDDRLNSVLDGGCGLVIESLTLKYNRSSSQGSEVSLPWSGLGFL